MPDLQRAYSALGTQPDLALTAQGPSPPPPEMGAAGGRHQPPPCTTRSHNGTPRERAAAALALVPGPGLLAAGEASRG